MENLDFLKCYYRPSFFRMRIDVPVDLSDLSSVTDGTFALYFHEYIHFIQDISTIYGLMNISTITYYIQDVAHRIGKQTRDSFQSPIPLVNDGRDAGYDNFLLKPIYIGSPINPKHKNIDIISYSRQAIQWGTNSVELIDVVNIEAKDIDTGEIFQFQLGGNHICEGMAYLCEREVYETILQQQGHSLPADEYPYLVAQKLAELIYPDLALQPVLVVASCDAALMTYHPGLSYTKLLEHLKATSFLDTAVEIVDLYKVAATYLKGSHENFETVLETVREQIKLNFKVEHFEGNNNWIDILFDRIKAFRTNVPDFVTDLIQFGELRQNQFFIQFHALMGSPLVINGEDDGTISLPSNFNNSNFHPHLFWAINQVLRVFSNNKPLPCELKDHCIKSQGPGNNIVVDHRCDTAPWSRCNDRELCPFAVMWKHWSLAKYEPTFES
ncbi:MAG: hypothetical protein JWP44_3389 [Mucilaginibacter sp.]|nr:hypothetical protein [Mucilaginibacter sp.]